MLGATVEVVEDVKKQYAFRLACKGVAEMWFAAESKEKLDEWISYLTRTALMSELINMHWHRLLVSSGRRVLLVRALLVYYLVLYVPLQNIGEFSILLNFIHSWLIDDCMSG